jgi:DNA-binding CsgD family transcriptional regulator
MRSRGGDAERWIAWRVVFSEMTVVIYLRPLERHMSKRKPAEASKRAHSPKIAARAHRNKQDIVRSAKDDLLRSVAAGPIQSPLELHDDSKHKAPIVVKQEASSVEKQKAPIAENRVAVLQDRFGQTKGFDFSLATANMLASQARGRMMSTTLTPREKQIIDLVVEGLSNKGIARKINVSEGTVKQHMHSIFQKLEVPTRTKLMSIVLRRDIS